MAAPYVPVRLRVALPCAPPLAGAFLWDASAPVAHLKRFCIGWARDHLVHAALASAGSSGKKRQQALREVKNADVNVLATAIESAMLPQLIGHLAVATEAAPKATSHAELLDANQADELLVLDVPIGNGMVYRDRVVWRANAHSLLGTADTDITRFARTASKDLDLPAGATQAIACSLREQVDAVRRQRLSASTPVPVHARKAGQQSGTHSETPRPGNNNRSPAPRRARRAKGCRRAHARPPHRRRSAARPKEGLRRKIQGRAGRRRKDCSGARGIFTGCIQGEKGEEEEEKDHR